MSYDAKERAAAWIEGYELGKRDGYADAKGWARKFRMNPYLGKADQPAPTETARHPIWCKCGDCKRTMAREIGVAETSPQPAPTETEPGPVPTYQCDGRDCGLCWNCTLER